MIAYRTLAVRLALAGALIAHLPFACGEDSNRTEAAGSGGGGAGPGSTSSTGAPGSTSSSGSGGGESSISCEPTYSDILEGDCDLLQQDCPVGQTCVPSSDQGRWSARCAEAPGLKERGRPCIRPAECQAGLFCIGNPNGRCTQACCPESGEPCGNGLCNVKVNFGGAFLWTCSYNPRCELFDEDACAEGGSCHISDPVQGLATCVVGEVQVEEGEHCRFLNDCKNMQHCSSATNGTCRYYCYLASGGAMLPGQGGCPDGQRCTDVSFGVTGVGLCEPI